LKEKKIPSSSPKTSLHYFLIIPHYKGIKENLGHLDRVLCGQKGDFLLKISFNLISLFKKWGEFFIPFTVDISGSVLL
jgi:hypothetical protein